MLVTCEHAANGVPAEYRRLFAAAGDVLASHRGFDAGAVTVARELGRRLRVAPFCAETTRLLVDLNRSLGHPRLFSEYTRGLDAAAKEVLLARHYAPYRASVEDAVAAAVERGSFVLHVSAHSFVPVLGGVERTADVGLLYDPGRPAEARIAAEWRSLLAARAPGWIVRRNYPYRGTSDGFTTHLRRRYAADRYAGIELEVNQRLAESEGWPEHAALIAEALAEWAARQPTGSRLQPARPITEDGGILGKAE